jgi:hypothetical protein
MATKTDCKEDMLSQIYIQSEKKKCKMRITYVSGRKVLNQFPFARCKKTRKKKTKINYKTGIGASVVN